MQVENLNYFDIMLTPAEMAALSSRPQDPCVEDPKVCSFRVHVHIYCKCVTPAYWTLGSSFPGFMFLSSASHSAAYIHSISASLSPCLA